MRKKRYFIEKIFDRILKTPQLRLRGNTRCLHLIKRGKHLLHAFIEVRHVKPDGRYEDRPPDNKFQQPSNKSTSAHAVQHVVVILRHLKNIIQHVPIRIHGFIVSSQKC